MGNKPSESTPRGPSEQRARATWRSVLRFVAQWAILGAAAYYLARGLVEQWVELKAYPWTISWPYLAASFVVTSLGYWMLGLGWHLGLAKLGRRAPWPWTMRAWWLGNLAKYVPGRVWIVFTRLRYAEDAGLAAIDAAGGFVLESLSLLSTGFLLFVALLPAHSAVQRWHYLLSLLALPLIAMLHPRVFNALAGLAMRVLRIAPRPFPLRLGDLALILGYFVASWAVFGAGVALLARSLVCRMSFVEGASVAGCFSFSFVAAMVSFVTPAGIAVREAIFSELIRADLGSMAIVVALASRAWISLVEVANVGLAVAIAARSKRPAAAAAAPGSEGEQENR